jgi:transcription elongation factor Elf1
MVFDGDTSWEKEVTCPWCGHKQDECHEYEDGEEECEDCGRNFDLTINEMVTYSTTKIGPKKDDVTGQ